MTINKIWGLDLGATVVGHQSVFFRVWSPGRDDVSVQIVSPPGPRLIPLSREAGGYFTGTADNVQPGSLYFYVLDRNDRYPDPASRFQPEGVHGPSQVIDPNEFVWDDDTWKGRSLRDFLIYELHTGTFTNEGTFESIIPRLDYLANLGITAIELMPVAQFPKQKLGI
jgi:maltooligosyltrehalose trehalohydrolase